ncbi:MAG: hypothetical protein RhofKO_21160 [Rhodothermales bacterium]
MIIFFRVLLLVLITCPLAHAQEAAPWVQEIGSKQFFAVIVSDLDQSSAWYARALGVTEHDRWTSDDSTARIINMTSERLFVELIWLADAPNVNRDRGFHKVGFWVPDVDVIADRVEAATSERPRALDFPDHELRLIQIKDPDGNTLQISESLLSDTSLSMIPAGPYAVGFQVLLAEAAAPDTAALPIYLWYPAQAATGRRMPYGDYLALTQVHKRGALGPVTDADWTAAADLPRGIARAGLDRPLTDAQWNDIIEHTTAARRDALPASGRFPLILGGLNGAQSTAKLAEHLASHGYAVASGPMPRAAARQQRSAPLEAVGALSTVLERTFAEVTHHPVVDTSRVALMGVNFDGYTVLDTQMRTGLADALVTLDGREAKVGGTSTTYKLPHFDPERLRVPYLAFSMDVDAPPLQPDEAFFEALSFSDREGIVLHGVEHFHYIGDLLGWPHVRDNEEPLYATLYDYILRFLDAHVKGEGPPPTRLAPALARYHEQWEALPEPPAVTPRLLAISVANLDTTVAWYRDVLGFAEVRQFTFPEDQMRLAFLARDGFELELIEIANTPSFNAPAPDNPATRQGLVKLAFGTEDIEALYAHARSQGADIQSELKQSNRTGGRFFIALDPDGNWVQVYD